MLLAPPPPIDAPAPCVRVADLGPVQETMLITLWARAAESRRRDAILRDAAAEKLVRAIDYDFDRFAHGWKSQVGVAVRARVIDDAVRVFLRHRPDGVVVNLGAGLDTRFDRVDNGRVHWIELDLPDAIAFRRRLLPESPRHPCWSLSALDETWVDRVRDLGRPVLIVSEGVLMFLPRDGVARLIDRSAARLGGATMIFDCIGRLMVRCPWLHDTLPRTRARFAWGIRHAADLAALTGAAEVEAVRPMLNEHPARWRWMRWLRGVPAMRRQFMLVQLRFPGTPEPPVAAERARS